MDRAAIITQVINVKQPSNDLGLKLQERCKELCEPEAVSQESQPPTYIERIQEIRNRV